jgi:mono/diheme cytochrome c family protein
MWYDRRGEVRNGTTQRSNMSVRIRIACVVTAMALAVCARHTSARVSPAADDARPASPQRASGAPAATGPRRAAQAGSANASAQPGGAEYTSLVSTYCVACHNDRLKTAGLSLQGLGLSDVPDHAQVWEKVARKLRSGEMPPPAVRSRPDSRTVEAFVSYVEISLDRAAAANPNPGFVPVHRLNRAEYSNAIRDLLAVDIRPGEWLPVDDSGYGFDNIAAVLSTSPALLDRYMSAARKVSRLAVGDLTMKPVEDIYEARRDPFKGSRNEQLNDDLPFDSRAGLSVAHYFPLDAEYVFKIRFLGLQPDGEEAETDPYQVRLSVNAGLHTVGVTSPRENLKPEREAPGGGRGGGGGRIPWPVDLRVDGARVKRFDVPGGIPEISKLIVGGPYRATGRGDTPSRRKIFVCHPAHGAEETQCARTIVTELARRAFRRPVTGADIQPLYAFYEKVRTDGDFESGIQNAIQALLVSPEFLFRIEQDPPVAQASTTQRISDVELASRLSFFLWSSIPDDELLDLAERRRLSDPAILERQVRRMLDDPRAGTLVSNFAGQWLHLRNVESVKPDPFIFPFDEALRQSFLNETQLFVSSIFREDRSLLELLSADYTFVNQRLAEHYGIPRVYGSQFRRVTLTDGNRRGLLGQGSILTVTSYPNRTSVVQRGKWILENLLGTPPPPPPPDVPELKAAPNGKVVSLREQMQVHRTNATCAACHARMDPIGFALENYDATGQWRGGEAGAAIDASGTLPDGTEFQGPAGLRQLLLTKYRDDFVRTAAEKLLTYALGRGVEYYDFPAIRSISREASRDNYRTSSFILAIVKSAPFQMRRASGSCSTSTTPCRGGHFCAVSARPSRCRCSTPWRRRFPRSVPPRRRFDWATSTRPTGSSVPATRARARSCGHRRRPAPTSRSVRR